MVNHRQQQKITGFDCDVENDVIYNVETTGNITRQNVVILFKDLLRFYLGIKKTISQLSEVSCEIVILYTTKT